MTDLALSASAPTVFSFDSSFDVRVILRDGEPWFVADDVCDALQLTNARMAIKALDDDERGVSSIYTPGGYQGVNIISESGLYTLVLRCRNATKPGTLPHRFRKWVTAEVLPAIRKTGRYPRTQSVRCSREQHQYLDAAIQNALAGLDPCEGYRMAVHNRLRVRFNLASIEDMTAEQLPAALDELRQIQQSLREFFIFRADLKSFLLKEVIGGGAPWTPHVARSWKARMQAELPARPVWLAMWRQLAQ